jgi:hypothetical protein
MVEYYRLPRIKYVFDRPYLCTGSDGCQHDRQRSHQKQDCAVGGGVKNGEMGCVGENFPVRLVKRHGRITGKRERMKKMDKSLLQAPLTPDETRWAMELADKLPEDVDLTFEEAKILARVQIDQWPRELLAKVRDVIDTEDFLKEDQEE